MSARSWDDEFRELVDEFLDGRDERLAELTAAIDALKAAPANREALDTLRRHFHRLKGTGATFGFGMIGTIAREGEALCVEITESARLPALVDRARWRTLVDQLRVEFASGRAELTGVPGTPDEAFGGVAPERAATAHDVLVADGDPEVRAILSRLLTQEGMQVRQATTLGEARAALEPSLPDALVVDVRLPDGSGYALVEEVRNRAGGESPAVVVLSPSGAFADRTEAIHAGADSSFDKPIDWPALVRKLTHLLERDPVEVPRVLVVEDDPNHAAYVRSVLESAGHDVRVCAEPRLFDEALAAFRPDLILMDIVLPELSGYDLARYVRQDDQHVTVPIIFLTGESQVNVRIKTVKAGGDDFLIKPVHPALLVSSVAARLERARFLKTLLNRDGLTRLLTHTSFMEQAQGVVSQRRRHPEVPASLVMVDIDHFKTVNDTFGHQAGDRVLVSLSTLLRRHLRRSDIVGRYGGEEFGVLLDQIREDEAVRLMQRLLHEFTTMEHRTAGSQVFRVSFSAGVARFDAATMDLERWLQAADAALYAAKRAGRNRVMTHAEWLAALGVAGGS
jgi:diguanylate cyclase (GGDEF)-like protein